MSMRSLLVALATVVVATPLALRAQESNADFRTARQQFLAGQPRQVAQTLLVASLAVRQEIGRSRDETVGMKLIEAEGQLEKLAASVKAGAVTGVKILDRSLKDVDRVLALHHLQLAGEAIAKPRMADLTVLAKDVDQAAFHYERSVTLDGSALAGEQAAVTADARTLAKQIGSTKEIPKEAAVVLAALERLVLGTTVVAGAR